MDIENLTNESLLELLKVAAQESIGGGSYARTSYFKLEDEALRRMGGDVSMKRDWINLFIQAKEQGLTLEEIREWIEANKEG